MPNFNLSQCLVIVVQAGRGRGRGWRRWCLFSPNPLRQQPVSRVFHQRLRVQRMIRNICGSIVLENIFRRSQISIRVNLWSYQSESIFGHFNLSQSLVVSFPFESIFFIFI